MSGFALLQRKADREMQDKMMEKMREMEEKMKVMQESGALEAQKHEMKQLFIDNLMKNQDVSVLHPTSNCALESFFDAQTIQSVSVCVCKLWKKKQRGKRVARTFGLGLQLTGMFDPVAGTVEMFEEYDEADLVAAWFSAEKGEELVGKKWDPEYDAQYMRQAIKGWGQCSVCRLALFSLCLCVESFGWQIRDAHLPFQSLMNEAIRLSLGASVVRV